MKKILLFTDLLPTKDVINKWEVIFKFLKKDLNCETGILSESRGYLGDSKNENAIDFFSVINKNTVLRQRLDEETKKEIRVKYSKFNKLRRVQFNLEGSSRKNTGESSTNEDLIYLYILYFERYLLDEAIDIALLRFLEANTSKLLPIIDSVCEYLGIKTLNMQCNLKK